MVNVAELWLYPVKSLRGHQVARVTVEPWGFAGDRRWMIVDDQGNYLTQRRLSRMATIQARNTPGGLRLSTDQETIEVEMPSSRALESDARIWGDVVRAVEAPSASSWLGRHLGASCRLVYMPHPDIARPVSPRYAKDAVVSFADGFPVLLTSAASLRDLNDRAAADVPMDRFRPNLVIENSAPWAEDEWKLLGIGRTRFEAVKPCARCVITTIDQKTGERTGEEPLRTLATFRQFADRRVTFGQNLIPVECGDISVGDAVASSFT